MKLALLLLTLTQLSFSQTSCEEKLERLTVDVKLQVIDKLALKKSHSQELFQSYLHSAHKEKFHDLIVTLPKSSLLKRYLLPKWHSKSILNVFRVLEEVSFDNSYFFKKLVKGEALSLSEKRAYYLLTQKDFWFENSQIKFTDHLLEKYSLTALSKYLLQKLEVLAERDQLSLFLAEINQDNFLKKLFHKNSYEAHVQNFSESIKTNEEILRSIGIKIASLERELLKSKQIKKNQLRFRISQLKFIRANLQGLKKNTILTPRLQTLVPEVVQSTEKLVYTLGGLFALTWFIDQIILDYVDEETIDTNEFMNELNKHEFQQQEEEVLDLTIKEELDRKLNSGDISLEEYLEALNSLEGN